MHVMEYRSFHLEVQMQDVLLMKVLHSLTDLPHEHNGIQLRQMVMFVYDAVEQLAALHADQEKTAKQKNPKQSQKN